MKAKKEDTSQNHLPKQIPEPVCLNDIDVANFWYSCDCDRIIIIIII